MRWVMMLTVAAGVACGGPRERPETTGREPVPVEVITVRSTSRDESLVVVGTVRAEQEVAVSARLLSYVRSVPVSEGDRVNRGQTLVVLDDRERRADLEAAQAVQDEAKSAIAAAEQGLIAARSEHRLAERTHARYAELLAKESVSQQEFDVVEARLASAGSALAFAESARTQAEAGRVRAAAALVRAEVGLGDTVITAPLSGVVTERLVDPGALAVPGAPLLHLEQTGEYRLEVSVPESLRPHLMVGQAVPIEIETWAERGRSDGTVVEVVPAIDPQSRTFTVKIGLADADADAEGARSGQFGKAFLPGEAHDAMLVPEAAVIERGQLRFVLAVEDGHARRRLVTVGESRDASIDVLSGLAPGDRVVVDPSDIEDGDAVAPRELSR